MKQITILAIETSCDETAAAILSGSIESKQPSFKFLSSVIKSQISIHQKTGGVVPEVAAREHMAVISPVVQKPLPDAKLTLSKLDYVAVTSGPGLIASLIVGTEFAKGIATGANIPLLPTNHMSGHLYSAFADGKPAQFPALAIIVSGGHTMFLLMKDYKSYKVVGNTVDDAAGGAFFKVVILLNLPYPGGPEISKLAQSGKTDLNFPRPMLHFKNFDFSFAGLKTAVLYHIDKLKKPLSKQTKADIAMSFENAVVDVITQKALKAVQKHGCRTITLAGGVAANRALRESLAKLSAENGLNFKVPNHELCGDNAQMIALAAYFNLLAGVKPSKPSQVHANPAWELL